MAMTLSSPAFQQNGHSSKHTCEGEDVSPPLAWEGVPTVLIVLIIDDPDAPDPKAPNGLVHWVVITYRAIPRGCPRTQVRHGCRKAPY